MKRTFSQANKANDSSSEDDGLIFFSKDEVEKLGIHVGSVAVFEASK